MVEAECGDDDDEDEEELSRGVQDVEFWMNGGNCDDSGDSVSEKDSSKKF